MYEGYWGLAEPPFNNSPNPKFFYLSPEHEEALVRLVYTVRHRKGCAMLTGEYGCGKTTLSRALIQRLEAERYEIALLTNASWSPLDFLREVLYQLGVETHDKSKPELLHQLNDVFFRNFQAQRDTVVIVDEAQLIEDEGVLEELRLLMNFQTDDRFLVTVLLIGSPELIGKIRRLKHLDQRIAIRYHLNTLDSAHTGAYIAHRLRIAHRLAIDRLAEQQERLDGEALRESPSVVIEILGDRRPLEMRQQLPESCVQLIAAAIRQHAELSRAHHAGGDVAVA